MLSNNTTPIATNKDEHLYLYALVRRDLDMPIGKLSAQAGHAYTDSLCNSLHSHPELYNNYRANNNGGSKVTLYCKNETQLLTVFEELKTMNIPCALVVDREHILLPHFDGSPIITALGIGPCTKKQTAPLLKKYRCV